MESKLLKSIIKWYRQIQNECEDFVLHNVDVTTVDKILKNLDVAKASEIDQISANFLEDGAPVIAINITNIINLSIKPNIFPSKCKIVKVKPLFKKGIKTEAKHYKHICLIP